MAHFRLMTLNLRASAADDGPANAWSDRWPHVKALINALRPNILGVQECMPNQMVNIAGEVAGYFEYQGPKTTLSNFWSLWNSFFVCEPCQLPRAESALALNDSGVIGHVSWDGREPRLAHILRFDGWVLVNTHFEARDCEQARLESARLLVDYLRDEPAAVIMGDLNSTPDSPPLAVFREAGYVLAKDSLPPGTPRHTFHKFTGQGLAELDYILYRNVTLQHVDIPRPRQEAPFLSDHDPVVAEIVVGAVS